MNQKFFSLALCAMLFALCGSAAAQQIGNIPRIGYLALASLVTVSTRIGLFHEGLRELGYVEGKISSRLNKGQANLIAIVGDPRDRGD